MEVVRNFRIMRRPTNLYPGFAESPHSPLLGKHVTAMPSGPPVGNTQDELTVNCIAKRDQEFASHISRSVGIVNGIDQG